MPRQNRVTPFGEIIADPARGLFMGNRGGRIHDPDTHTLTSRRWTSRRWICCLTAFKGRRRTVMGDGYTELFFLDEATALAAGHRPCFECRRADAKEFARLWAQTHGLDDPARADEMDTVLHRERLQNAPTRHQRLDAREIAALPDGAMIALASPNGAHMAAHAVRGAHIHPWTPGGYAPACMREGLRDAILLTPPATCAVLAAGYRPTWHVIPRAVNNDSYDRVCGSFG